MLLVMVERWFVRDLHHSIPTFFVWPLTWFLFHIWGRFFSLQTARLKWVPLHPVDIPWVILNWYVGILISWLSHDNPQRTGVSFWSPQNPAFITRVFLVTAHLTCPSHMLLDQPVPSFVPIVVDPRSVPPAPWVRNYPPGLLTHSWRVDDRRWLFT